MTNRASLNNPRRTYEQKKRINQGNPRQRRNSVGVTSTSRRQAPSTSHSFPIDFKIILLILAIVLIVFCLVLDSVAYAGKFYEGVKIGSVDVSGLTEGEAKEKLQEAYESNLRNKTVYIFTEADAFDEVDLEDYFQQQDRVAEQITSLEQANDAHIFQTNAADVGANYNYDLALHEAIKPCHDINVFERLITRFFGITFNLNLETGDGLDALYSKVAAATGEPHIDFGIEVNQGVVSITEGHDGKAVNREKFSTGLTQALTTSTDEPQKVLFDIEDDPVVINEAKAQIAKLRAESIIENGATFSFNGKVFEGTKADLGDWISTSVDRDSATLNVSFDDNKSKQGISKLISDSIAELNVAVSIKKDDNGEIVVNPTTEVSVPDLKLAVSKLKENKLSDVRIDDVIDIPESEQKDNFSFDTALEVGLITEISSYTTTYTSTSSTVNRNHNIALVSDAISNTIVPMNDGVFSFNSAAGPTDASHGYLEAGTTVGTKTVQETAGGICQVATTVFNAAYEGGYSILERHNHNLRNLSYPHGRDAAVYVSDDGSYELDLRWENDTTSDVLLKSWHDDTSVTVALYGTSPGRHVESIAGDFEEGEKHEIIFTEDSSLPEGQYNIKTVGADGTKITVQRKVYDRSGNLLYFDSFYSVYAKIDEEITIGPDTDKDKIKEQRSQNQ